MLMVMHDALVNFETGYGCCQTYLRVGRMPACQHMCLLFVQDRQAARLEAA